MREAHQAILLQQINSFGDPSKLVQLGYSYAVIMDELNQLYQAGHLVYKNDQISLTESGLAHLQILSRRLKDEGPNAWIQPEKKSRKKRLPKDQVYVPGIADIEKNF